ncbi:MAG: hypothetical protein B7Z35_04325 [Hydrogenophilales bacterium 12-61-10]|nr:MAG: hypothetical protein B7Z35_04325 [Hydrogenophilales bacterium 12-61-10]
MAPRLSVVIPSRDCLAYLPDAIASIRAQEQPGGPIAPGSIEIVVVDDGSTDGTGDWLKAQAAHDPLLTALVHAPAGVGAARNAGIAAARAEIIAFLDADDQYLPDALSDRLVLMEQRPAIILSFAAPLMMIENLSGAVLAARNWLDRELVAQIIMIAVAAAAILVGLPYGMVGVATGMVIALLYMSIHMFWLAKLSLNARWADLARAFMPAVLLNTALLAALWLAEHIIPPSIRSVDALYVLLMAIVGGLVYALCFLYLPIPALATETTRWKVKLKLAKAIA